MPVCLITGGQGFIATALISYLTKRDWQVVVASRNPKPGQIAYTPQALAQAFKDYPITHVVHLAARKDRVSTTADLMGDLFATNVEQTLNLATLCSHSESFRRFVFLGTCDEYGMAISPFVETMREEPVSAYGASKLAATQALQTLARSTGFPVVIARPSLVYGPGQKGDMFIPSLLSALHQKIPFQMSSGTQLRDFLFIHDLLEALEKLLLCEGIEGSVINLASGKSHNLNEVVQSSLSIVGDIAQISLIQRKIDYDRVLNTQDYRVSITRAATVLGWRPGTQLRDGLKKTLNWLNNL